MPLHKIPVVGWIVPWAESREVTTFNGQKVRNFGVVKAGEVYRSAYLSLPAAQGMRAAFGLKTVVDLRGTVPKKEMDVRQEMFERAGFTFINIPFDDKTKPSAALITRAYDLMTDARYFPLIVHCAGGRHRTGGVVAFYRQRHDLWTRTGSYEEAVDFGFYSAWGHGDWKRFILEGTVSQP